MVAHLNDERTTTPMTIKKYVSSTRRRTPWEDNANLSSLEVFINNEYHFHYDFHHSPIKNKETALLNSIEIEKCRLCNSNEVIKKGLTRNGIQRYFYKTCGRRFTPTTGTIFEDHKLSISEWIEFLLNLFGYSSLNLNSKVNKNANTTAKYWLKKIFLLLEE